METSLQRDAMNQPDHPQHPANPATGTALYTGREAARVLALMICITVALDFARQPVYFLIDPIRATFGMTDVQSSMLLGAAFALPLTVMSLVGGWLSDRGARRWLVAGSMLCQAAGVCLFALAERYPALVAGRMLVGLGAGIVVPVAMTWISDAYPEERRGKANGLYFIILSLGPAYGGAMTGTVEKWMEPAMAAGAAAPGWLQGLEPWRVTMCLLALPSLLFIPTVLLLQDRRRERQAGGQAGLPASQEGRSWRLAALMIVGVALMVMVDTANITWMPTVLKRKFGWDAQQVGFAFGLIAAVAGVAGPMIGGWMGDKVYQRHGADGRLWLSAVTAALCSVLLFAYFSNDIAVLMAALAANGVLTVAVLVMGYLGLQAVLPADRRGFGTGMMAAANSLVGAAGPTVVALVSDRLGAAGGGLGTASALVLPALSLVAAGAMAASAWAAARAHRATK